jgi:hypothetical protein
MKAIAIPAYRRPDYLEQNLAALVAAKPDGYKVFVSLDKYMQPRHPLKRQQEPEMGRVLARYADKLDLTVQQHTERKGIDAGTHSAPALAFSKGAEFVVYVEEDGVVATDALRLSEWYVSRDVPENELCLRLSNVQSDPSKPDDIMYTPKPHFGPFCWVATRFQWESYFNKFWFDNSFVAETGKAGWDYNVFWAASELGLRVAYPLLSRAKNIGREKGEHTTIEHWDAVYGKQGELAQVSSAEYRIV